MNLAMLRVCAWLVMGGFVSTANALEADPNLSQLIHQQWQTEDGLPQNAVHCLTQDHDGFIWLGTENGLVRFDGVTFETFTEQSTPRLLHNFVSSLLVARDGSIWAGTRTGGLCRYRNGKFDVPSPEFERPRIFALAQTGDGAIWAATPLGLLRWDGTRAETNRVSVNGLVRKPTALLAMQDGSLLIGTESGEVVRSREGRLTLVAEETSRAGGVQVRALAYEEGTKTLWVAHDGAGLSKVNGNQLVKVKLIKDRGHLFALLIDHEKNLWIGSQTEGIIRLRDGVRVEAPATSDLPSTGVLSLFQDQERSIWVGTHFSGLSRLRKGKAVTLTESEGLSAPTVSCVVQKDPESLWIGTIGGGLLEYRNLEFVQHPLSTNKSSLRNDIRAMLRSSSGDLWIGTQGAGIGRLNQNGHLQFFNVEDGLSESNITALAEVDGNIWIGTVRTGICIFETATGRVRKMKGPPFLQTHIRAFAQDRKGNVWIGTQNGLVRYAVGAFHDISMKETPELSVRCLLWESDDTLWVGSRDDGLLRIRGEEVVHYNAPRGLIHNRIYQLLATTNDLFLAGNRGIERITRSDLEEVARGTANRLNTRLYGKREGLLTSEAGGDWSPSALIAPDGGLWFGTRDGLTHLRQSNAANSEPPNVLIRSVTVDETKLNPAEFRELLPGQTRLQVDYTALSLRNPANVFFKYKLEGLRDSKWIDAGRRREAVYYSLDPGEYKFHVQACNDEGIWNEEGATLAFTVVPTIYQSLWFKALAGGTGILALLGGYRWRVRSIRARNKWLQTVVNERTRELLGEVSQRTEAEKQLRVLNEELENRVIARTAEVRSAYENLQIELHERQEAERALARSEARLRRMVDSGMVGILFWERSGAITEANDTFLTMVGYSREDLDRGEILWNMLTPSEHSSLDLAALDEIRRTGVCTPYEKEYLRKDGTRIPILIGGASLGGDADKGVAFVLDISKLKETEEEIRQLNLRLEARVHERTLELAHTNEQLAAEVQEREKVGIALAAFSHLGQKLHSARTEKEAAKIVAQTAKSLIPHDVCSIELYNADGKLSPVLESLELPTDALGPTHCSISVPIRNGTRVVGVLGLKNAKRSTFEPADANTLQALGDYCGGALERIHAEEAKRETERRFSTFMTNAPALAWMKDSKFRYVFTNAMFQRFLGLEAPQIEGKTDYDLWPDHVAFGMRTNDNQAVKSQAKLETQEQFRRHDGEQRTLLTLRFLFTTAAGEQYVAGMAVDITEQKRAEDALHRLPQSILEAQETERRRVARELHDGVNQAIASIKFRLQTAEQQILRSDPRWQETCGKTKDMLDSVLHQVRRLSRNLRPSELDDFGLVAAARSACQEFELRNGIHISFTHSDFAERLPPALELSLYRIIQEALTNVEKHSGATAVEINLAAEETTVLLQISDNGCGFPQAQSASRDSGLGLLHMRERASLVGGVFSMESAHGKGVQLTVQAPIDRLEGATI